MMPTPFPTLPLLNGPFHGQRRPIIDGHIPGKVERLNAGRIEVYEHVRNRDGTDHFVYRGSRAICGKLQTD